MKKPTVLMLAALGLALLAPANQAEGRSRRYDVTQYRSGCGPEVSVRTYSRYSRPRSYRVWVPGYYAWQNREVYVPGHYLQVPEKPVRKTVRSYGYSTRIHQPRRESRRIWKPGYTKVVRERVWIPGRWVIRQTY